MPADQAGPAQKKGLPLWVILGGGAILGLYLYSRHKASAAATGSTSNLVPATVTDPNTGLPVDPLTGLPYSTTPTQAPDNNSWGLGAEQWLTQHGVSGSLASQAIYDYLNGNLLSAQESNAIDKVLSGGYGFPPNELPFGGNPVLPKPTPTPAPSPAPAHINAGDFPQFISQLQHKLVALPTGGNLSGGAPVYALVQTAFGPVYEQGQAVQNAKMYGGTLYTLPEFKDNIVAPKKAA